MDHSAIHLDTCGPTIYNQPPGFQFDKRKQTRGDLDILVVHMDCNSKLALATTQYRKKFGLVLTLNEQRCWPEDLLRKSFVLQESFRTC